mmetsp:Transcript_518/g.2218  ORF Transcript_518/g.2218 Transcript_518/m.2218 type:complete len:278 (-) Transcript_518:263-1096(-)
MLENQVGRCAYSGMIMECLLPHYHWRMSLERLDNKTGYFPDNCVLVAAEFNTPDHRARSTRKVNGSAQWSAEKVMEVPRLRESNVDLAALKAAVKHAGRSRDREHWVPRKHRFEPNVDGEWFCTHCETFKPSHSFYLRRGPDWKPKANCKDCCCVNEYRYACTLRGTVHRMVANAQMRSKLRKLECRLSVDFVLDTLLSQGGRCFYSGVPMTYTTPHSDWRLSLERIDNDLGYTPDNSVLIVAEFNTSDYSRRAVSQVFGTAQWSKDKVAQVWGDWL